MRRRLQAAGAQHGFSFAAPPLAYCTDNAAMIALAGAERLRAGLTDGLDAAGPAALAAGRGAAAAPPIAGRREPRRDDVGRRHRRGRLGNGPGPGLRPGGTSGAPLGARTAAIEQIASRRENRLFLPGVRVDGCRHRRTLPRSRRPAI